MKKALVALFAGLVLPGTNMATDGGEIVIGMPAIALQSDFHAALAKGAAQAAARLGARMVIVDSHGSPFIQSDYVKSFVAQKVLGILIAPMPDPSGPLPAIEAAVKAGIPVATVDTKLNTDKVLVHVGVDNREGGRAAAKFIIDRLGNKGRVIELEGGPKWPTAEDRKAGFDEVMKKSNVTILVSQTAYWSRSEARRIMESLIKIHPGFDAVFAACDDMILGAIDAMSAAHIDPSSKVTVGFDAIPDAFQYMKDGKLSATVDGLPGKQTGQALEYLVGYIKNKTKPPKQVVLIKPELVTKAPVGTGS